MAGVATWGWKLEGVAAPPVAFLLGWLLDVGGGTVTMMMVMPKPSPLPLPVLVEAVNA